jgi:hypothetical protein
MSAPRFAAQRSIERPSEVVDRPRPLGAAFLKQAHAHMFRRQTHAD